MNCLRKSNRPMPTDAQNEEGRPPGQPSSECCSAEVLKPDASLSRLFDALHLALVGGLVL